MINAEIGEYSIDPYLIKGQSNMISGVHSIEHGSAQFDALARDIESNGQMNPVTIWRGEIIDGRSRVDIAKKLKKKVIVQEIMWNTDLSDIELFIKKIHSTKLQSKTAHMLNSVEYYSDPVHRLRISDIAKRCKISNTMLNQINYIKKKDIDIYNKLKSSSAISILSPDNVVIVTDKISTIYKFMKNPKNSLLANDCKENALKSKEIVYIISDGDLIKVGRTSNIEARLLKLQTGNGRKLFVVHKNAVENASSIESSIHNKYSEFRTIGEWFNLSDSQIAEASNMIK